MVQRMWAEASGPIGGAEPLFPGSRRSRSVWDAVRLEVGVPDSCPVVLHSFTQLDPDLPRLEVGEPRSNVLCSIVWGWGISSLEIPPAAPVPGQSVGHYSFKHTLSNSWGSQLNFHTPSIYPSTAPTHHRGDNANQSLQSIRPLSPSMLSLFTNSVVHECSNHEGLSLFRLLSMGHVTRESHTI